MSSRPAAVGRLVDSGVSAALLAHACAGTPIQRTAKAPFHIPRRSLSLAVVVFRLRALTTTEPNHSEPPAGRANRHGGVPELLAQLVVAGAAGGPSRLRSHLQCLSVPRSRWAGGAVRRSPATWRRSHAPLAPRCMVGSVGLGSVRVAVYVNPRCAGADSCTEGRFGDASGTGTGFRVLNPATIRANRFLAGQAVSSSRDWACLAPRHAPDNDNARFDNATRACFRVYGYFSFNPCRSLRPALGPHPPMHCPAFYLQM